MLLLVGLLALVGIYLTHRLTMEREARNWRRDKRLESYVRILEVMASAEQLDRGDKNSALVYGRSILNAQLPARVIGSPGVNAIVHSIFHQCVEVYNADETWEAMENLSAYMVKSEDALVAVMRQEFSQLPEIYGATERIRAAISQKGKNELDSTPNS